MRKISKIKRLFKSKKILFVFLACIVIAIIAVVLIRHFNQPAVGTISTPPISSTVTNTDDYTPLNTSYYSLLYPSQYLPRAYPITTDYLDYKSFGTDDESKEPSVVEFYIKNCKPTEVVLDSDYKYFASNKEYKLSNTTFGQEVVQLASHTDGSEQNALWQHGDYLLVVKLKSPDKSQDIENQINSILNSVQWK